MKTTEKTEVGGWGCPVKDCPVREVVPNLIRQHLIKDHPEAEPQLLAKRLGRD